MWTLEGDVVCRGGPEEIGSRLAGARQLYARGSPIDEVGGNGGSAYTGWGGGGGGVHPPGVGGGGAFGGGGGGRSYPGSIDGTPTAGLVPAAFKQLLTHSKWEQECTSFSPGRRRHTSLGPEGGKDETWPPTHLVWWGVV